MGFIIFNARPSTHDSARREKQNISRVSNSEVVTRKNTLTIKNAKKLEQLGFNVIWENVSNK